MTFHNYIVNTNTIGWISILMLGSMLVSVEADLGTKDHHLRHASESYYKINDEMNDAEGYRLLSTSGNGTNTFKCEVPAEDCNNHGACNKEGTDCICDDGYLTFPDSDAEKCNYKQKKQWIAFTLEFIFGIFAGGSWYLERTDYGLIKISVLWLAPCFLFIVYLMYACFCAKDTEPSQKSDDGDCCAKCVGYIWGLTIVAWWLADWIIIASGNVKDGNGASMESW